MQVKKSILMLTAALLVGSLSAQEPLEVSGFFQARTSYTSGKSSLVATVPTPNGNMDMTLLDSDGSYTTGDLQQMNLLFRKELNQNFTAWVNLEFLNTFSTERDWGAINLEEAWVRYSRSSRFAVKVGLVVPTFNYFNEVKNRMPLIPYISRPLLYEPTLRDIFPVEDFIPERALIQGYGKVPVGKGYFSYAAYLGKAETSYWASNSDEVDGGLNSSDTTNFFLVGGRVGLEVDHLNAGVSATFDKDNQQPTLGEDVNRIRIGADAQVNFSKIFGEGEIIIVKESPEANVDLNKMFYYATLGVNLSESAFVYGNYSELKDNYIDFLISGLQGFLLGAGYRPTYSVVLKAQYSRSWSKGDFDLFVPQLGGEVPASIDLDYNSFSVAVSVLF